MLQISLAQVRANAARLVATALAIVIAVGFIVATLVLDATSKDTVYRSVAEQYATVDAVADLDGGPLSVDDPDKVSAHALDLVRKLPQVAAADLERTSYAEVRLPGTPGRGYAEIRAVSDEPSLRWQHLDSGRLPTKAGEIAVASQVKVPIGDKITVFGSRVDAKGTYTTTSDDVTVVGVVDQRGNPRAAGTYQMFATSGQVIAWGDGAASTIRAQAKDGTSQSALAAAMVAKLDSSGFPYTQGLTGAEKAEQTASELTGDATAITTALLAFAGVAVLVSALVIANTFAVLLAQRTRELALLRAVGATGKQVRRGVLTESAVIGFLASVLGVVGGVGVAAALVQVGQRVDSPVPVQGLSVPWTAVAIGVAVGVVMTVAAAVVPALRATRVSPLAAMRPTEDAPVNSTAGLVRLGLGLIVFVPGAMLLIEGARNGDLNHGVVGGAATFLGIVLLSRKAVPVVVAAVGRATGRLGGVPGEMASANALRNPQRTAATATALLIGVTLTTTMVVGVASVRSSTNAILDATFDTDVLVNGSSTDGITDGALPTELAKQVADVKGVSGVLAVRSVAVEGLQPGGGPLAVEGVDTAVAPSVARSDADLPKPGEIVVARNQPIPDGTDTAQSGPDDNGRRVAVTANGRTKVFVVRRDSGGRWPAPRVTAADLAFFSPDAPVTSLWIRLDDATADSPIAAVQEITDVAGRADDNAVVSGPAQERAAYDRLLDIMLLIVTALLAVAVLIAVIGVGNTIALSVIERRQETGLLRALGLTRRQLRTMLLWEAALVAGVASLMGVGLGVVYGLSGTSSVLTRQGDVTLSVPWLQVVVIVLVATAAGAAASVLPSRRAARTSPVEAMSV